MQKGTTNAHAMEPAPINALYLDGYWMNKKTFSHWVPLIHDLHAFTKN